MDKEFITWLMGVAPKSGVSELEYSDGDARIRIVCSSEVVREERRPVEIPSIAKASVTEEPVAVASVRHEIKAGVSGLFYRSSSPGAEPFVKVGDTVEEGTTVGLLEAMKMLTPLESDKGGKIIEIVVDDGATIDAGTVIFVLEPNA
ncbi:hypothetical protein P6U16_25760 (plasmid) [Rhizobium sp. 32-5/1]|uniref:acetyl-CoA carboxylase biotin carboxyl carrier protein n=1 Tax=Rhizobium sp. 32-5/1 TaxID=3019602 RepID=UPI00240D96C8|nr:biotin/lipoyl-containing protein [Rhizobium sp. 32-5/1]WEZ85481.1 hypothetical protein P6U16_25760 [Rhizobium sp. 32-5/1]